MPEEELIRIGTRRSPLAQAQTDRVIARLPPGSSIKLIVESHGDIDDITPAHQMERPGAFTSALTDAILQGHLDAAVHSLKDLPLAAPPEAPIVAILPRDDPADVLMVRRDALAPERRLGVRCGARVGTSAPRRQAQLLAADPDLVPVDVRGNVGTRLALLSTGAIDGLVMAAAAIDRLALPPPDGVVPLRLEPSLFPGCPGQGAIAVQARHGTLAERVLGTLDDPGSREAVGIERDVLARLGGGCGAALGVFARRDGAAWKISATFADPLWVARGRFHQARTQVVAHSPETAVQAVIDALEAAPTETAPGRATRRIAITLDDDAVMDYDARVAAHGWRAVPWSLLAEEPTTTPLPPEANASRWIAVTSPRGAPYAAAVRARTGGARVAALGPATAHALRRQGLPVHAVSADGTGDGLATAIGSFRDPKGPVLLVQAEGARPDLAAGLRSLGIDHISWECYRTLARNPSPDPPPADAVLLTSPSNVRAALGHRDYLHRRPIFAIGKTTAEALVDARLSPAATLPFPSPGGLAEALS